MTAGRKIDNWPQRTRFHFFEPFFLLEDVKFPIPESTFSDLGGNFTAEQLS